jgi:hypothetical protein
MDYDMLVFPELLAYYDTSLVSNNVIYCADNCESWTGCFCIVPGAVVFVLFINFVRCNGALCFTPLRT